MAVAKASSALRFAAGNFYVNDKPTGAVVGQQPFGGARASGTNDKAGSPQNLLRWASARTIKETFVPPTNHRYPAPAARISAGTGAGVVRRWRCCARRLLAAARSPRLRAAARAAPG